MRVERKFLSMCLTQGASGREHLARLTDDHLSSVPLRAVRDWLRERFEEPLEGLPADDPSFSALVTQVAMGSEEEPASETVLGLSFLQLDARRIERRLRRAEQDQDFDRQRDLWSERERVRAQIEQLMGEAI